LVKIDISWLMKLTPMVVVEPTLPVKAVHISG
jgi:hypothetical protein